MKLKQALSIALNCVDQLKEYCDFYDIAGSIRRDVPDVNDIEIVCQPRMVKTGLFSDEIVVDPDFCKVVNQWKKVKGEPDGKYTQRLLPQGIKLDLFMANERNYGLILGIRTGSARFSKEIIIGSLKRRGYKIQFGHLWKPKRIGPDELIDVGCEEALFHYMGMDWVEPEKRNLQGNIIQPYVRIIDDSVKEETNYESRESTRIN